MKYNTANCKLISKNEIAKGIFDFKISCPETLPGSEPGQFAHILVPGKTLRRPISVCDYQNGVMRIVFEVRGEGTEILAETKQGESLDILAPLGRGFNITKGKKYLFVGGGIGVPPLLYAAKKADVAMAVLGFRNKAAVILKEDFESVCKNTLVTTDDGSSGIHGFVTEALAGLISDIDEVCACGPMPMLRSVARAAKDAGKLCQVSLEERMGCGVGACLVCACKTRTGAAEGFSHVCKDGPVFRAEEVFYE